MAGNINLQRLEFCPQVQTQALNLKFKGSRNYVHGSDIYNSVQNILHEQDDTQFVSLLSFRHFGRQDCDVMWKPPVGDHNLVAMGKFRRSGEDIPLWIVDSKRPILERYEFDEEALVEQARIDGQEIDLRVRSEYTPIEEIIALTKRLNYELTPDIDGKWVFGQLNVSGPLPDAYSTLKIRRTSELPGRFSVNKIVIDDTELGDIRFIVGNP